MRQQLSREQLITVFSKGEVRAFKMVFDLYNRDIYYFVYRIVKNREEAEDIVSTTFVKVFNLHTRFKTEAQLRSFLYVASGNAAKDLLRARKRRKEFPNDLSDLHIADDTAMLSASEAEMIELSLLSDLYREINNLPPQCSKILKMLYFDGREAADIAVELSIAPATVRSQKRRGLKLLREKLGKVAFAGMG